jgi:hypothetical protein
VAVHGVPEARRRQEGLPAPPRGQRSNPHGRVFNGNRSHLLACRSPRSASTTGPCRPLTSRSEDVGDNSALITGRKTQARRLRWESNQRTRTLRFHQGSIPRRVWASIAHPVPRTRSCGAPTRHEQDRLGTQLFNCASGGQDWRTGGYDYTAATDLTGFTKTLPSSTWGNERHYVRSIRSRLITRNWAPRTRRPGIQPFPQALVWTCPLNTDFENRPQHQPGLTSEVPTTPYLNIAHQRGLDSSQRQHTVSREWNPGLNCAIFGSPV